MGEESFPQSIPSQHKGLNSSLFREIMHKHGGELHHYIYRWEYSCTCTVRKYVMHISHVQNGRKSPSMGGSFSIIMKI